MSSSQSTAKKLLMSSKKNSAACVPAHDDVLITRFNKNKFFPQDAQLFDILIKQLHREYKKAHCTNEDSRTECTNIREKIVLHKKRKKLIELQSEQGFFLSNKRFIQDFSQTIHDHFITKEKTCPFSIITISIEDLALFNDVGGHQLGDDIIKYSLDATQSIILKHLKKFAPKQKIPEQLRIYRRDGTNITIIVDGIHETDIAPLIQELTQQTKQTIQTNGGNVVTPTPFIVITLSSEEIADILNKTKKTNKSTYFDIVHLYEYIVGSYIKFTERAYRLQKDYTKKQKDRLYDAPRFDKYFAKTFGHGISYEHIIHTKQQEIPALATEILIKKMREKFALSPHQDLVNIISQKVLPEKIKIFYSQKHHRREFHKLKRVRILEIDITEAKREKRNLQHSLQGYRILKEKEIALQKCRCKCEQEDLDYRIEKAQRDTLTGLYNKRKFYEMLKDRVVVDNSNRVLESPTVLMIDLAFLKYFDSEGGRIVGDLAILHAVRILEKTLLSKNFQQIRDKTHIFRYGGDEFSLIIEDVDHQTVLAFIQAIKKRSVLHSIPYVTGKSTSAYVDIPLLFHIGFASKNDLEINTGINTKKMAESLLMLADINITKEKKTMERTLYFLSLYYQRFNSWRNRRLWKAFANAFFPFSQKALLASPEILFNRAIAVIQKNSDRRKIISCIHDTPHIQDCFAHDPRFLIHLSIALNSPPQKFK